MRLLAPRLRRHCLAFHINLILVTGPCCAVGPQHHGSIRQVYSLHTSMDAVVKYLEKVDPERATKAKQRYSCFDKCALCCCCIIAARFPETRRRVQWTVQSAAHHGVVLLRQCS